VILIHLLLILSVLVALLLQLIMPLVLNIPLIAFILAVLVFSIWHFKRRRSKGKFPIVASVALMLQGMLFILSLAIFFVVTIPHESAGDSPAVVQGLRRMILGESQPVAESATSAAKPGETLNAPDEKKIQITIEGEEPAKTAEEKKSEP
jgi:hypothetical protein